MFGNILAFRRYRPGRGMFGTEWTLRYFERFLKDPAFWRAFRNTLVVSLENLVINFPLPIIFAILLNEVRNKHLKKVVQTISYMPRFISTVIEAAPASMEFSASSFITEEGRSMTSPAAISSYTLLSSRLIFGISAPF